MTATETKLQRIDVKAGDENGTVVVTIAGPDYASLMTPEARMFAQQLARDENFTARSLYGTINPAVYPIDRTGHPLGDNSNPMSSDVAGWRADFTFYE